MALSHYQANSENRSEDLGTRLGFLLGNSGVIAINAVIAHDLGDNVSSQAGRDNTIFFSSFKYIKFDFIFSV